MSAMSATSARKGKILPVQMVLFSSLIFALAISPGSFSCGQTDCSFTITGGSASPVDVFILGYSSDGYTLYSQRIEYIDGLGDTEQVRLGNSQLHPAVSGKAYTLKVFLYSAGAFRQSPANYLLMSSSSATFQA